MKIGIIREGKVPPDSRVPLIPSQCKAIMQQYPQVQVVVQPSVGRCYKDEEYEAEDIPLQEDLSDCDLLMGVKEVPVGELIAGKSYHFFSHTIKAQPYNRKLLQACVEKNIRLMDYEVLTDGKGRRVIAFGVFAGMVGAHNALYTYAQRTGAFVLPRMKDYFDYQEAMADYQSKEWPTIKIVLTGKGRVGSGAQKVLDDMGIREVTPADFLQQTYGEAVYTQLECEDYATRKDGGSFSRKDFYTHPKAYQSIFTPYAQVADVMVNGIYWDNDAPAFFTAEEMQHTDFNIRVIADVTCDIAPVSSIPSTLFASTIAEPIFGYNPHTRSQDQPHQPHVVDMMTIDNLPNELPRDASRSFGEQFIASVLGEHLKPSSSMLERASVSQTGNLGPHFEYLRGYLEGVSAQ